MQEKTLLFLGFGNLARFVFQACAGYKTLYATTRGGAKLEELFSKSIEPIFVDPQSVQNCLDGISEAGKGARVLVTFPPDGVTDELLSGRLVDCQKVVYISSTSVYGNHTGIVNELSDVDRDCQRAQLRIEAERLWSARCSAVVLRAPALYGSNYGLHKSLLEGKYKLPGQGERFTSRIHMEDLARIVLAVFDSDIESGAYPVGDLYPCTQIELVTWLCARMSIALPASIPSEQAHHTLRSDRKVDSSFILSRLGCSLKYPTYKEGFEQCLSKIKESSVS